MKRILIISYHTCPLAFEEGKETGGMNVYVYELSKSLARIGHSVDVITRCQDKDNLKIITIEKNFRVIHLPAGPHGHFPKSKLIEFIPDFVKSFKRLNKEAKVKYDLIHAHYYQSGLIALEINKLLKEKIPLVLTFHTLALMKNLVARSIAEMDSQFRINAEFDLMKRADAIIAPSFSDKEYLRYLYQVPDKKIFEIQPGINNYIFKPIFKETAKKHLGIDNNEKIILFVGRIEPLKGIDLLLYAIKILISQVDNLSIRLLIIGGDVSQRINKWSPQLKQLEKLRRTLNISTHADFIGQKQQKELPYYYNAAEMVVMPSHYESFGMAAAEAMACGTPVITTNATGISNLIEDLGSNLITSVSNPLLLAAQMKKLLTDEKLYQEIRDNIIKNIRSLNWDFTAQKIDAVYTKLIR